MYDLFRYWRCLPVLVTILLLTRFQIKNNEEKIKYVVVFAFICFLSDIDVDTRLHYSYSLEIKKRIKQRNVLTKPAKIRKRDD